MLCNHVKGADDWTLQLLHSSGVLSKGIGLPFRPDIFFCIRRLPAVCPRFHCHIPHDTHLNTNCILRNALHIYYPPNLRSSVFYLPLAAPPFLSFLTPLSLISLLLCSLFFTACWPGFIVLLHFHTFFVTLIPVVSPHQPARSFVVGQVGRPCPQPAANQPHLLASHSIFATSCLSPSLFFGPT